MGRVDRELEDTGGAPEVITTSRGGDVARVQGRLATLEQELELEREERFRLAAELTLELRRSQELEAELAAARRDDPPDSSERLMSELGHAWDQIRALNAKLGAHSRPRWWRRG